MNKLLRHIEYNLQYRDCVIVPGLGAILAHTTVSHFDTEQKVWHAPRRIFSFNPELTRTDGVLAQSIARRESINIDAAANMVRSAVDVMKSKYLETGNLDLGSVGHLLKSENGAMIFTPSQTQWVSPNHLWLPSLDIAPLKNASKLTDDFSDNEHKKGRLQIALRRIGNVAACLVLIFCIGWAVKSLLPNIQGEQYASVAPIIDESKHDPIEEVTANNAIAVVDTQNRAEQNNMTDTIVDITETPSAESEARLDVNDKYFLIVASLSSLEEAQDYLRKNSDIKLGILTIDGRYRIYAASANSYNEAITAGEIPEIASRYTQKWVCRR